MSYTEEEWIEKVDMLQCHIRFLDTNRNMLIDELYAANDERFRLEEKVDTLQEAIGEIYTIADTINNDAIMNIIDGLGDKE